MKAKKLNLEELDRVDIETFKAQQKTPIHVVLDDIRSGLNVGSFFRTSDALAIERISLCGITPTPPHKEILKTAIGSADSVTWNYYDSVQKALESDSKNRPIVSIEQTDSSFLLNDLHTKLSDDKMNGFTLIFGNEVHGVSEEAIKLSDYCCEIPQYGTKHSLNVSVCGGIVLWEFAKELGFV